MTQEPPLRAKPPVITDDEMKSWLIKADRELFLDRATLLQGRRRCSTELDRTVGLRRFSNAVQDHCRFFKQVKLKSVSQTDLLYESRWDALHRVVSEMADDLRGLTLRQATTLVRTRIATNETQLCGLPKRLQVWTTGEDE